MGRRDKQSQLMRAASSVLFTLACIQQAQHLRSPFMALSLLPMTYLILVGMATDVVSALILTLFWAVWMVTLCAPFYLFTGKFILMCIYIPLVLVFGHKPAAPVTSFYLFLLKWTWDRPLLIWVKMMSTIGYRGFPPFMNIIEDTKSEDFLIVGSVPMAADVFTVMKKDPYNIGCVVNMCREYKGPQEDYLKNGIVQFHAPTPDMCEPSYGTVVDSVAFLRLYHADPRNKGKKGFIHCKGGRARSGCVALCYLISCGYSIDEGYRTLKASRGLADARLPKYKVVKRFSKELEDCSGKFERLHLREVASRAEIASAEEDNKAAVSQAAKRSLGRKRAKQS